MENNAVDKPMEAPAAILLGVAAASALPLGSLMMTDFVWGPPEAAKVRTATPAHAAAPVTKPG
jgi:hypothetical protein